MTVTSCSPSSAPAPDDLFAKIRAGLQQRIRAEHFETWFRSFQLSRIDDDQVEFTTINVFARDWIVRNFLKQVQDAVEQAIGDRRRVRVTIAPSAPHGPADAPPPAEVDQDLPPGSIGPDLQRIVDNVSQAMPVMPPAQSGRPGGDSGRPSAESREATAVLNPRYTFEEFVVGNCNRLAHAAAMAIGSNPGQAYNPFFVHGDVGLGKTHLLQAICHALLQMHPGSRVIYLSCEDFTNRFIEASQNNSLEAFRSFYRSADILVIDDVEFLMNKNRTQNEFFHTFNALYNAQKQIVLSSDRRAPAIPTLEDRLVSRFRWGMEAEILPPCAETRAAIVKRKAFLRSTSITDEVAQFIAESVTNNIRELEGALIKVLGLATIDNRPIDVDLAREALGPGEARKVKPTLDRVMQVITKDSSVSVKDIVGKGRTQAVSLPRQIGMFLARAHTEHSLEEIGRFFGGRDHTTVLYAVGKIKDRAKKDRGLKTRIDDLARRLHSHPADDS